MKQIVVSVIVVVADGRAHAEHARWPVRPCAVTSVKVPS